MVSNFKEPAASRLFNMAFMQRSLTRKSNDTGDLSSSPATKKRRIARQAQDAGSNEPSSEQEAVDEREQRQQEALALRAMELGDSHWVLYDKNFPGANPAHRLNVIHVGFNVTDRDSDESDDDIAPRRFWFNKPEEEKKPEPARAEARYKEDEDDDSIASDNEDDYKDAGNPSAVQLPSSKTARGGVPSTSKRKRLETSAAGSTANGPATAATSKRRRRLEVKQNDQEVNLSSLTAISGVSGGGQAKRFPSAAKDVACFACGKRGHMRAECPLRR